MNTLERLLFLGIDGSLLLLLLQTAVKPGLIVFVDQRCYDVANKDCIGNALRIRTKVANHADENAAKRSIDAVSYTHLSHARAFCCCMHPRTQLPTRLHWELLSATICATHAICRKSPCKMEKSMIAAVVPIRLVPILRKQTNAFMAAVL